MGPDANVLGTASTGLGTDFAIKQAYVALRVPVGNGLDFKVRCSTASLATNRPRR